MLTSGSDKVECSLSFTAILFAIMIAYDIIFL